jgi:quercetin 2,3-dioxygenase
MKKTHHAADTRIVNDLGWLRISASFRENAPTHDRRNFGSLVVVDDALMIPGGRGFKLHPHENMEIISWVLSGTDEHVDSKHGVNLLRSENVQLMSAGTGIQHAENNWSEKEAVHMFQIWVTPKKRNVEPRYQTKSLQGLDRENKLLTFISPDGADGALAINQDAYFSITTLEKGKELSYKMHHAGNGVYIMVLFGEIKAANTKLRHRDALGVETTEPVLIKSLERSEVLFIEIPME